MRNQQIITAKPLTAEAFKPFGDVIEVDENTQHFPINDGNTERFHDLATIDVSQNNGRTLVNIFRSTPLPQPVAIKMMERHPLSSQAFIPMGNNPYLVVVAPKGELELDKIAVFLAQNNQGVNYAAGTWHHYCLALHDVSDFLVIDRGGEGENCDVIKLNAQLIIDTVLPS